MLQRGIVALVLSAAAVQAVEVKDQMFSVTDIAKIKGICRQAIGYPVATERVLWSQLTPFLRSKAELDHLNVDCSSQHCSGSIRLRDDAEVLFTSVHVPPQHSDVGPGDLAPDIEFKGNNRFVGVALLRYGKVIFKRGELPQWFIDAHKRYKM